VRGWREVVVGQPGVLSIVGAGFGHIRSGIKQDRTIKEKRRSAEGVTTSGQELYETAQ
jgi:hypothetical protein